MRTRKQCVDWPMKRILEGFLVTFRPVHPHAANRFPEAALDTTLSCNILTSRNYPKNLTFLSNGIPTSSSLNRLVPCREFPSLISIHGIARKTRHARGP